MEQALLVTVDWGKRLDWSAADERQELEELVRSAGVAVTGEIVCRRAEPTPGSTTATKMVWGGKNSQDLDNKNAPAKMDWGGTE